MGLSRLHRWAHSSASPLMLSSEVFDTTVSDQLSSGAVFDIFDCASPTTKWRFRSWLHISCAAESMFAELTLKNRLTPRICELATTERIAGGMNFEVPPSPIQPTERAVR